MEDSPGFELTAGIHKDEAAAIALASLLNAGLLVMDDRKGAIAAEQQGLNVTGTIGVLDIAAERGLIDLRRPSRLSH